MFQKVISEKKKNIVFQLSPGQSCNLLETCVNLCESCTYAQKQWCQESQLIRLSSAFCLSIFVIIKYTYFKCGLWDCISSACAGMVQPWPGVCFGWVLCSVWCERLPSPPVLPKGPDGIFWEQCAGGPHPPPLQLCLLCFSCPWEQVPAHLTAPTHTYWLLHSWRC